MEQYNEKMEIIESILNDTITDEVCDAIDVESSKIRSIIKSWYSIQWLRNNGVESDLVDTILTEGDHAAMVKDISDRHSTIAKLLKMVDHRLEGKLETSSKRYGEGGDGEGFGDDVGGFGEEGGDPLDDDLSGGETDDFETDPDLESDDSLEDTDTELDEATDSDDEVVDPEEEEGPEEIDLN